MAISFWRGKRPKTTHEADAQTRVVADLKRLYFAGDEPVVIAFDVWFTGADIDMLVLKHDALIIVELKHCASKIRGGVNGDWEIVGSVPKATLKGGTFDNPFLQIQHYYYRLREYLEENKMRFLEAQPASQIHFAVERGANHRAAIIDAILAFDPTTHPDSEIDVKKRWLRLSGLNDLAERIYDTHSGHAFSEEDLSRLVEVMGCKQDQRYSEVAEVAGARQFIETLVSPPPDKRQPRPSAVSVPPIPAKNVPTYRSDSPEAPPNPVQPSVAAPGPPYPWATPARTSHLHGAADAGLLNSPNLLRLPLFSKTSSLGSCSPGRGFEGEPTRPIPTFTRPSVGNRPAPKRAAPQELSPEELWAYLSRGACAEAHLLKCEVGLIRSKNVGRDASGAVGAFVHKSAVTGVAVSPDGRRAVSASLDGTLKIWDLEAHALMRTLCGHAWIGSTVALAADGRAVFSSRDGALGLWDLQSGVEVLTLSGHSGRVNGVAISRDAHRAVSGSQDRKLKVWDLEAGTEISTFVDSRYLSTVAVNRNATLAVSTSSDLTLKVWNLQNGEEISKLTGHSSTVTGAPVGADGRWAVSGSADSTLKIWSLETGAVLRTLRNAGYTYCVALSADGRWVVSSADDNSVRVWDLTAAEIAATVDCGAPVYCCAIADNNTIVAGDKKGNVHFLQLEIRPQK